jgi:hypothetical protein
LVFAFLSWNGLYSSRNAEFERIVKEKVLERLILPRNNFDDFLGKKTAQHSTRRIDFGSSCTRKGATSKKRKKKKAMMSSGK